eukprot:13348590-Alexandrium_andersonii.AAC.1
MFCCTRPRRYERRIDGDWCQCGKTSVHLTHITHTRHTDVAPIAACDRHNATDAARGWIPRATPTDSN